ncbi:MAG: twin-arginine translocation signal domain-containing protein [bacterium]
MEVTRRSFLKFSGGATAFLLAGSLLDWVKIPSALAGMGLKEGIETTSICCFCGCGCGVIVTVSQDVVINVEGDPTHPVNEGALCSKGVATRQISTQTVSEEELNTTYAIGSRIDSWPEDKRLARVLHRAAGDDKWTVMSWEEALPLIGQKIASTRQDSWETTDQNGMIVNRTRAIAAMGGAAHDSEECHLMRKFFTGLGLVYIEHQARL